MILNSNSDQWYSVTFYEFYINDGHFRRGQKPNRWSPGAGSSADIKQGVFVELWKAGVHVIGEFGHQAEGENLSFVGVGGTLEVEKS